MLQQDWLTASAEHARSRADDGIRRAREHAARAALHDWTATAVRVLTAWAASRGEFLAEEFIQTGLVTDPPDPHAWGGVFRNAARAGVIVRVGFARADTSNGSFRPTWRAAA